MVEEEVQDTGEAVERHQEPEDQSPSGICVENERGRDRGTETCRWHGEGEDDGVGEESVLDWYELTRYEGIRVSGTGGESN